MKVQNKKELNSLIQKKGESLFPDSFTGAFDFDEGNLFETKTNAPVKETGSKATDATLIQRQTEKQTGKQQTAATPKPTSKYIIYIYRLTHFTPSNYAITKEDLTDATLNSKVAPEIARIMNNNWLDSVTEVKVITQAEAEKLTSEKLAEENAAILPVVQNRSLEAKTQYIGRSYINYNGSPDTDPEQTYLNLGRIIDFGKSGEVTTNYSLAYIGAHEALHQLYAQALAKLDKWTLKEDGGHSFGLNEDGQSVSATDFKQKLPEGLSYLDLKNMAEWIPFKMKQDLNAAAKK